MASKIPTEIRTAIAKTVDELWEGYGRGLAQTDPARWDTSALRRTLLDGFSDAEVEAICFDAFPAVQREFTSGMKRTPRINLLLEHCRTERRFQDLAAAIERSYPDRFKLYERQLVPAVVQDGVNRNAYETRWRDSLTRYFEALFWRVGYLQILGRRERQPLAAIFTDVNVLETPKADAREDLSELPVDFNPRMVELFGGKKRVPGEAAVAEYPLLFVLGGPGTGKTTFLKHTALRAIRRELDAVPVFIVLHEFGRSEQDVVAAIEAEFAEYGLTDAEALLEKLLRDRRLLLLLDGLDEVPEDGGGQTAVVDHITRFVRQHRDCRLLLSSRVSVPLDTGQFRYVEMAEFNAEQIGRYIDLWFADDEEQRQGCRSAIFNDGENAAVRELVREPLLLSLVCLVYDDLGRLPANRVELYDEATDALLTDWEREKGIQRDPLPGELDVPQKQALLAHIARETFEQSEYLVKERRMAQLIDGYLRTLPKGTTRNGRHVLRLLERHHGILVEQARRAHSFSHLTLQEYYMARAIVADIERDSLQELMQHVGDKRWDEVFLLTAGMLSDRTASCASHATEFCELYLAAAWRLVADDDQLADCVRWTEEKRAQVSPRYRAAAARAFLLSLDRDLDLDRALALALARDHYYALAGAGYFARFLSRDLDRALARACDLDRALARARALDRALDLAREVALGYGLAEMEAALATLTAPAELPENEADWQAWIEFAGQLAEILTRYEDEWNPYRLLNVDAAELDERWDWSRAQSWQMVTYLEANRLLVNCMAVAYLPEREALEDRILLPVAAGGAG